MIIHRELGREKSMKSDIQCPGHVELHGMHGMHGIVNAGWGIDPDSKRRSSLMGRPSS